MLHNCDFCCPRQLYDTDVNLFRVAVALKSSRDNQKKTVVVVARLALYRTVPELRPDSCETDFLRELGLRRFLNE